IRPAKETETMQTERTQAKAASHLFFIPVPRRKSCTAGSGARKVHVVVRHTSRPERNDRMTREAYHRRNEARCGQAPGNQERRQSRANFPLPTHSVFREKNVSREKGKYSEPSQTLIRDAAQLSKRALQLLANGVRGGAV